MTSMLGMLGETHDEGAIDAIDGTTAAFWPAVGDLMACLFGLFVLFFVWAIAFQVDLSRSLEVERKTRTEQSARADSLEKALAQSLGDRVRAVVDSTKGRVTFVDGRIGIGGSVLFSTSSADLQGDGESLLRQLGAPLAGYVASEGHEHELIMVSGFTDSAPVQAPSRSMRDNWDLSASRALTVVRALIDAGVPRDRIFAAGFGDTHPISGNDDDDGRAKNRRVEIATVPGR